MHGRVHNNYYRTNVLLLILILLLFDLVGLIECYPPVNTPSLGPITPELLLG